MDRNRNRSRLPGLAIILLLLALLLLMGGCSAPLLGSGEDSQEPSAPSEPSNQEQTGTAESPSSTEEAVEDMEIEPEDILEGGADPEKDATQAPSKGDDTLKHPQEEEDSESESAERNGEASSR